MKVLFATDGSSPAREGESLIAALFSRKSSVHVITVEGQPLFDYWPGLESAFELNRMDVPVLNSAQISAQAAERLGREGFQTSTSTAHGSAGPEVVSKAVDGGFDVVVLGASHNTWMGNVLLGSVSTFVLHHAPCSVLVAHHAPRGSGRILLGTDGSEQANNTLSLAARLLDPSRCSFHVATAVVDPWVSVAVYPPGPPFGRAGDYRELERERVERGWLTVEHATAQLQKLGFKAEGAVLAGNATHQLLKERDNVGADLVVVGSRGLGAVRRALLGSVSDQLVRHAPATLVGRSG